MTLVQKPKAGDFAVVLKTKGILVEDLVSWGSKSKAIHSILAISDTQIVEAMPGGAKLSHIDKYPNAVWSELDLSTDERANISDYGFELIGTPYNWIDDAAIGLAKRLGVHSPKWVWNRLSDPRHLECAQLVDYAYQLAGIHLFFDGRLPGQVSPGDLFNLILDFNLPSHKRHK